MHINKPFRLGIFYNRYYIYIVPFLDNKSTAGAIEEISYKHIDSIKNNILNRSAWILNKNNKTLGKFYAFMLKNHLLIKKMFFYGPMPIHGYYWDSWSHQTKPPGFKVTNKKFVKNIKLKWR